MKWARWAALSLVLSAACGDSEVTIEEFVAEFGFVATEFNSIATALNDEPMPARTGDREADRKRLASKLRADAATFDSVIERLRTMRVPSGSADAEELRRLLYETTKLSVDGILRVASAIENGDPFPDASNSAEQIARNMTRMADHADALGMDSSGFRMYQDMIEDDFVN